MGTRKHDFNVGSAREAFGQSWLSNQTITLKIDRSVALHYQQKNDSGLIPVQSISSLAIDLNKAISSKRHFTGSASCALVGELLFCSEKGNSEFFNPNPSAKSLIGRLYSSVKSLRDACFHPAYVNAKKNEHSPIDNLAIQLGNIRIPYYEDFGDRLRKDRSLLMSQEILVWAIRWVSDIWHIKDGQTPRNAVFR